MTRLCSFVTALLLAAGLSGAAAAQPAAFSDWSAVVVAADWRGGGGEIENFDNARRDVVAALTQLGFQNDNIAQLSVVSQEPGVGQTTIADFVRVSQDVTSRAQGGCLFYFTSHGSPQGMSFGREGVMPPEVLAQGVDQWCTGRPTVIVVSACFSGVFVPVLSSDERMILTAARPDRSSFGCSAGSRYPYFDQCVLESLPASRDFPALGAAAQTCVAQREQAEGLSPASEPQLSVGASIAPVLAQLTFPEGRTSTSQADAPPAANDNAKPPEGEPLDQPAYEEPQAQAGGKA